MNVFIDTGAVLAIADKSDMSHALVTSIYQQVIEQRAILYTSNYIIDETITLIRARVGHKAATSFINGFAASKIKVLWVTRSDEDAAKEIFIKYKDKDFSFTDWFSFSLIDRYLIDTILSLDAHFNQYGYKQKVRHLLLKQK